MDNKNTTVSKIADVVKVLQASIEDYEQQIKTRDERIISLEKRITEWLYTIIY